MRHLRLGVVLGALVLGALVLGGCGTDGTAHGSGSSPTPTGSPGPCRAVDLRFTLSPGEGAAGSTYYRLRMTNTSATACVTGGYGGVSLVPRPGGKPIGAPADRLRPGHRSRLTLRPGATAEATLRETSAENYPRSRCHPVRAHGLRVYPPDETRSVFVPHATMACAAPGVHLLELSPYARVGR